MSTSGFRSLADQLRSWPDARLSRLLTERPDLATPAPHDSAQLASRAATRSSILRALDQLTRAELAVLDALVLTGRSSVARLQELVNADPAVVAAAVERLLELALAWESTGGLRALTGVADGLAGTAEQGVSGLRPFTDPPPTTAAVEQSVAALSEPARAMLEHVVDAGGEATTGSARVTVLPEDAATPAEELLSRRLLVPRAGAPAVVPGEVGVALRSGRTTAEPVDAVPTLATSAREAALVDRAAAGAAFEAVRRLELLLDHWGAAPPSALRSGGPGRARPAGHRDRDAPGRADRGPARRDGRRRRAWSRRWPTAPATRVWLPTDLFDAWVLRPTAERWTALVRVWLDSPRMPGLVGSRDPPASRGTRSHPSSPRCTCPSPGG